MNINKFTKVVFIAISISGILSCKSPSENQSKPPVKEVSLKVFNVDNREEMAQFDKLNMDKTHPNMLDPRNSKSENEKIKASWIDLHQSIGNYLAENNFSWGVEDQAIKMFQKIYFEPNGQLKTYTFKIVNRSISAEKKEEFGNLIAGFAKTHKVNYSMDKPFAQCGKTSYQNN